MGSVPLPGDHTIDAFHRGGFWLVQPGGRGHRAGMDALVLASAVPDVFGGRVADFGAGAGAAGMAVIARCRQSHAVLVESSPEMAAYAGQTRQLDANAHLRDRISLLHADVTLTGKTRIAAGLGDASFDFVIMNPPFNAGIDRASPDPLRRQAHVMTETDLLERWIRSAAAVVSPRGGIAIIARPQSLAAVLTAFSGRFGSAQIVPVHPRADAPAIRIVVRAMRASRGALSLMPGLVLQENGSDDLTARANAILDGHASLFGD